MRLSKTVILVSLDYCDINRCDSDASLSATLCSPHHRVRYSLNQSFSTLTVTYFILVRQTWTVFKILGVAMVSKIKDPSAIHLPSDRLEVTVHTVYEEYPMSRMNSYPDKSHEIGIDDKVEGLKGEAY